MRSVYEETLFKPDRHTGVWQGSDTRYAGPTGRPHYICAYCGAYLPEPIQGEFGFLNEQEAEREEIAS